MAAVFQFSCVGSSQAVADEQVDRLFKKYGAEMEPVWDAGLPSRIVIRPNGQPPQNVALLAGNLANLRLPSDTFSFGLIFVAFPSRVEGETSGLFLGCLWRNENGATSIKLNKFDCDEEEFLKESLREIRKELNEEGE